MPMRVKYFSSSQKYVLLDYVSSILELKIDWIKFEYCLHGMYNIHTYVV